MLLLVFGEGARVLEWRDDLSIWESIDRLDARCQWALGSAVGLNAWSPGFLAILRPLLRLRSRGSFVEPVSTSDLASVAFVATMATGTTMGAPADRDLAAVGASGAGFDFWRERAIADLEPMRPSLQPRSSTEAVAEESGERELSALLDLVEDARRPSDPDLLARQLDSFDVARLAWIGAETPDTSWPRLARVIGVTYPALGVSPRSTRDGVEALDPSSGPPVNDDLAELWSWLLGRARPLLRTQPRPEDYNPFLEEDDEEFFEDEEEDDWSWSAITRRTRTDRHVGADRSRASEPAQLAPRRVIRDLDAAFRRWDAMTLGWPASARSALGAAILCDLVGAVLPWADLVNGTIPWAWVRPRGLDGGRDGYRTEVSTRALFALSRVPILALNSATRAACTSRPASIWVIGEEAWLARRVTKRWASRPWMDPEVEAGHRREWLPAPMLVLLDAVLALDVPEIAAVHHAQRVRAAEMAESRRRATALVRERFGLVANQAASLALKAAMDQAWPNVAGAVGAEGPGPRIFVSYRESVLSAFRAAALGVLARAAGDTTEWRVLVGPVSVAIQGLGVASELDDSTWVQRADDGWLLGDDTAGARHASEWSPPAGLSAGLLRAGIVEASGSLSHLIPSWGERAAEALAALRIAKRMGVELSPAEDEILRSVTAP